MAIKPLFASAVTAMVLVNLVPGFFLDGYLWRPAAYAVTMLLMVGALALVGYALADDWRGVLVDKRNVMSLSRLQLVVWTVLVVCAILSAGILNTVTGAANPLALSIPAEIWIAVGISGTSFVAAPLILNQKGDAVSQNATPDAGVPKPWAWSDVFLGDLNTTDDKVDLSKVQQFFFTVIVVAVYAVRLGYAFATEDRITFPAIDAGFIQLLGISNAAYLIHKAT